MQQFYLTVISDIKKAEVNNDIKKEEKEEKSPKKSIKSEIISSPKKSIKKVVSTDSFMKFQWPWTI